MFSRRTQGLWLILLLLVTSICSAQNYTPNDIKAAMDQKNYKLAESELRSVIASHANSTSAHYLLAQALVKEGNLGEAQDEAVRATELLANEQRVHPQKLSVDPNELRDFSAKLNQALAPVPHHVPAHVATPLVAQVRAPASAPRDYSTVYMIGGFLLFVTIIGILWTTLVILSTKTKRVMTAADKLHAASERLSVPRERRQAPSGRSVETTYSSAFPPSTPVPPPSRPYVQPSMGMNPGAAPSPQQGHSTGAVVGAAVAGGLAGLALGEILEHRHEHHEAQAIVDNSINQSQDDPGTAFDELRSAPIDYGNTTDNSWNDNTPAPAPSPSYDPPAPSSDSFSSSNDWGDSSSSSDSSGGGWDS